MRRAITAVSGCVLLASLALAGCGSSSVGSDDNAATLIAASSDKTAAAKTAAIEMAVTLTTDQGDTELHGTGVADLAGNGVEVSFPAPAGSSISGSLEELFLGGTLYLHLPEGARSKTGGKAWVAYGHGSTPGESYNQDPNAYLKSLKNLNSKITKEGHETIRGTETTHYKAHVKVADISRVDGLSPDVARTYKEQGISSLPMDIYLDNAGLTRRISMQLASSGGTSQLKSAKLVMDFYDFGKADTSQIVVPPADDTIDVSKVPALQSGLVG
jgi:hypothetical protein